jgi:hypothetical protein
LIHWQSDYLVVNDKAIFEGGIRPIDYKPLFFYPTINGGIRNGLDNSAIKSVSVLRHALPAMLIILT